MVDAIGPDGLPSGRLSCASISITVIVFSRNAVETIEQTLASVVSQNYKNLELIVLDGGSTDGTADVIRQFERQIFFWRSFPDGGPTNAINEGVQRATGDVVCLLPADDWLEPGSLIQIAAEFAADSELDVLSCGTRYASFAPDGTMQVDKSFVSPDVLAFNIKNIVRHPLTASRFMRRRVYQRFGGHSLEYKFGDFDFLIRVCLDKVKSRVLSNLTYTYRRHPGSSTLSGNPDMLIVMASDAVKMASSYLDREDLTEIDRAALLALHGRSSARHAWMSLVRGQFRIAGKAILQAIRKNPFWPLRVIGWLGQRALGPSTSATLT